ncbi:hypothetical protein [Micromonospora fulviviridis]|uniref:Uncharacterized protein n=1 Tax=Micromonospora fulviviridis TaxID=47860 RepID=A0ABV2VW94_9ACTN
MVQLIAALFALALWLTAAHAPCPSWVVREPRTASMSAVDRQQAVTALAVMIHE